MKAKGKSLSAPIHNVCAMHGYVVIKMANHQLADKWQKYLVMGVKVSKI